jgi:hypothetical protein
MDPWVYKFSKENMDNFPMWHKEDTLEERLDKYGMSMGMAQTPKHHKHSKKDIAERGMDEEVHGFTTANLPPLNTRVRSTLPFMSNGSKSGFEGSAKNGEKYGYEGSFSEGKHHHKHHKKDIGERGYDTDVT